jgi:hypothetical protein
MEMTTALGLPSESVRYSIPRFVMVSLLEGLPYQVFLEQSPLADANTSKTVSTRPGSVDMPHLWFIVGQFFWPTWLAQGNCRLLPGELGRSLDRLASTLPKN